LLAGALGLAGAVRDLFVAAARGRASSAEVLAAIQREAAEDLALAQSVVWEGCPYLGLMPFQERDAKVFYGRGDLVAQLVQRLAERLGQSGILLVTGESGAGKSSLLRAGLIPLLAAGALGPGSQRWPRRVVRLIAYPPLKAALDAGPFTVGPMSEAELRLAMTGPAAEAGLVLEPVVVEAVISELREGARGGLGSGVLPLISQAMAAAWESREGSELTLRAYRRAGGIADAVNRSAQAAYNSLTRQQQDTARLLFTQLTTIILDGQFERRRCSRAELRKLGIPLAADIDAVINVFSAQRLLVLGEDSVEISHDILLQTWNHAQLLGTCWRPATPISPPCSPANHCASGRPRETPPSSST